jgi:hypothetical protein
MDWKKLFYLPKWDDEKMSQYDDEGDEWKNGPIREVTKAMYLQWEEFFYMAVAVAETLSADERFDPETTQKMMYENLMIVAPKIMGAASTSLYVLKMENAAIIRQNCKEFMDQLKWTWLTALADKEHIETLEASMQLFKERFIEWVATFEKDEFQDEWGLFV